MLFHRLFVTEAALAGRELFVWWLVFPLGGFSETAFFLCTRCVFFYNFIV